MQKLEQNILRTQLNTLPGWSQHGEEIRRRFPFDDYAKVIRFVNQVAAIAQKQDHHPDLLVTYGAVEVRFTTHDAGGVTQTDIESAKRVEAIPAY